MTKVKYQHWIPRLLRVNAIVLYPYVLYAQPEGAVPQRTIQHESVHVTQVQRVGRWRFYVSYVFYWLAGYIRFGNSQTAYLQIPYEIEAYNYEKD